MLKWFRNSGPGVLVAAAFIGPGTVPVCTIAGLHFGYALLWAMGLSAVATILLQEMSARLGMVTQKGLADVIRGEINNPLIKFLVLGLILFSIVIGNAIYEAGNISGAAMGVNTMLGWSAEMYFSRYSGLVVGLFAFILLFIGSYKILERALVALVVIMSLAFLITAVLTRPNAWAVLQGLLVPQVSEANLLTVVGLIGTTVVPYNLFLHASLVKEKWKSPVHLKAARRDTIISVGLGGLVSMAIIVSAAAIGRGTVSNATDLARSLEPLFGSFSKYFLSLGLFAAGITSAITAPLAAAYVASGCLGWNSNLKSGKFRLVWMFVLAMGVAFSSLGISPIAIIRFAQFANGLALPIVVGIMLWIMNQEPILKINKNNRFQNIAGVAIFIIATGLGIKSMVQVISSNKMKYTIDINADLGEGAGQDAQLMPYLSSCNIACGIHAGDESTMKETVRLAIAHGVHIGAHPSFPDRANFGRTEMHLPANELTTLIIGQIATLKYLVEKAGGRLHHVKAHGALYNMAAKDIATADAVLDAMTPFDHSLVLYVPYGSVIAQRALERNIAIRYEAFADRNYNEDLTLVSRKSDNAVINDPEAISERVIRMVKEKKVESTSGKWVPIEAATLCVHGDNPNALHILSHLTMKLKESEIIIE